MAEVQTLINKHSARHAETESEKKAAPSPDGGLMLTLNECIEIAIQSNLGLKLSRISDRQSDYSVRAAWAQFYPTFNQSIVHNNRSGRGLTTDGSTDFHSGVTQVFPTGTRLDFAFDESRTNFNRATRSASVSLAQPLWKGAGTDANLTQVRTARINRLITRGNLDLDTQTLIFSIRKAYADISRALQVRETNRQAALSAKTFVEYTVAREKAGQDTRVDISQAELQLSTRELALTRDEVQIGAAYDTLKQLMDVDLEERIQIVSEPLNLGESPAAEMREEELLFLDILETDETEGTVFLTRRDLNGKAITEPQLVFRVQRFDEKKVLEEAMQNRIDLLNGRRLMALQHLQTMLTKNGLGYQIDLVGSFANNFAPTGGRSTGLANDSRDWSVGVNAVIPWGKIADRAAYDIALLDLQRSEINLKRVRSTVHEEVRDIMRRLRQSEKSILIQALRVEQAKLNVRATIALFRRGLRDSFQVVRVKDDLLAAKTDFITNVLDYTVDLARLELVIGKATGRVDLDGESAGGWVSSQLPASLNDKIVPRNAPDAVFREENCPKSDIRSYRVDPDADLKCKSAIFSPK